MKTCWETAGCAITGKGHISFNEPCQDKICLYSSGGVTAAALSDGAGRARLSHIGASRAVDLACRKLCRDFYAMLRNYDSIAVKQNFLYYLRNKLSLLAEKLRCRHEELFSTLLAAAADDKHYIIFHVGDGVIGAFSGGKVYVVSESYNGQALTESDFILRAGALRRMKLIRGRLDGKNSRRSVMRPAISGFVLMSDGADSSYYDSRRKILVPSLENIRDECFALEDYEREDFLRKELTAAAKHSWTVDDCSMILMNRI